MTVQDKEQLVNNVTAEIGEFLTVVQTNKVKETLANELQSYDVVALTPGEVDTDSMNMLQFFLDAKRTEGRLKFARNVHFLIRRIIMIPL